MLLRALQPQQERSSRRCREKKKKKKDKKNVAFGANGNYKGYKKFKGDCGKCGKQGHKKADCWSNSDNDDGKKKNKNKKIEDVRCFKCEKKGHYANKCPNSKKKKKEDSDDEDDTKSVSFVGFARIDLNESELIEVGDLIETDDTLSDIEDTIETDEEIEEADDVEFGDFTVEDISQIEEKWNQWNDAFVQQARTEEQDQGEDQDEDQGEDQGEDEDQDEDSGETGLPLLANKVKFEDEEFNAEESAVACYMTKTEDEWVTVSHKKKKKKEANAGQVKMLADSGANTHVCTTSEKMQNLRTYRQRVKVGGANSVYSTHKGDLVVRTARNKHVILRDMLVVPEFGQEIVNVCELSKQGVSFVVANDSAKLQQGGETIHLTKDKNDDLFYLVGTRVNTPIEILSTKNVAATEITGDEETKNDPASVTDDEADNSSDSDGEQATAKEKKKTKSRASRNKMSRKRKQKKAQNDAFDEDKSVGKRTRTRKTRAKKNKAKNKVHERKKRTGKGTASDDERVPMDINEGHYKYGHACEATIRQTMKYYNLRPTGKLKVCDGCAKAKAKGKRLSKINKNLAKAPCDRISVDTSGPFHATSKGSKYWWKAIDQYSDYCFDRFAKKKSEIPGLFEELAMELKGAGRPIKCVRCDDAGEHVGIEAFCKQEGIAMEQTGRNTPERNGQVERRFATDGQRATAAMISAKCTREERGKLWAEYAYMSSQMTNIQVSKKHNEPP